MKFYMKSNVLLVLSSMTLVPTKTWAEDKFIPDFNIFDVESHSALSELCEDDCIRVAEDYVTRCSLGRLKLDGMCRNFCCLRHCQDSSAWSYEFHDCDYVSQAPRERCNLVSADGISAKDACRATCNNCDVCWDDLNYDCAYVSKAPTERCNLVFAHGISAKDACRRTCHGCDVHKGEEAVDAEKEEALEEEAVEEEALEGRGCNPKEIDPAEALLNELLNEVDTGECKDKEGYVFVTAHGHRKNCDWVSKKPKVRCGKFSASECRELRDLCPETCDWCVDNFEPLPQPLGPLVLHQLDISEIEVRRGLRRGK